MRTRSHSFDEKLRAMLGDHTQRTKMWWTLALFMLSLWMLGVATSTGGSAIHVLLITVVALLALLWLRKRPLVPAEAKFSDGEKG